MHTAQGTNALTALSKESELGTCFSKQENVEQQGLQLDSKSRKNIDYSRSGGTHTAASLISAFLAASQVFGTGQSWDAKFV